MLAETRLSGERCRNVNGVGLGQRPTGRGYAARKKGDAVPGESNPRDGVLCVALRTAVRGPCGPAAYGKVSFQLLM